MSQPSNIVPSASNRQLTKLSTSAILKEQPEREILSHLFQLINRLVKLYQIQGWGKDSTGILAEWVLDNYKYESLELVTRVLTNPPKTQERNWRLTPDVIADWMAVEMERDIAKREKEVHNAKHGDVPNEWPEERLKELQETLKKVDDFVVPSLTESDIIQEGQEQPKKRNYQSPDKEYFVMMDLRSEYGRLHTDLHTGKVKEGAPSFDEFLRTNHK